MTQVRRILLAIVGCLAMLIGPPAVSGNGIQRAEFEISDEVYIDCLGEVIAVEERVEVAYLTFNTPSGNSHLIDNWKFYVTATGMTTGRMWFGVLPSPSQFHDGPAQVGQYAVRGVVKGVDKGTPNFAWSDSYKVTVNANGDLVVEKSSDGFSARCLGKK